MKIVLVYNASSGIANSLLDIGHKILSPDTYACNLCKITFGIISENEEWKRFRESSEYNLEFLHKDEFEKKYQIKKEYPVILRLEEKNEFTELIRYDVISKIKTVNELIQKLNLANESFGN